MLFSLPSNAVKYGFYPISAVMDLWGGGHWADAFPKEKLPKIYND